jgi:hypothetical protein
MAAVLSGNSTSHTVIGNHSSTLTEKTSCTVLYNPSLITHAPHTSTTQHSAHIRVHAAIIVQHSAHIRAHAAIPKYTACYVQQQWCAATWRAALLHMQCHNNSPVMHACPSQSSCKQGPLEADTTPSAALSRCPAYNVLTPC